MNFMKLEELRQTNINAYIEEASRYFGVSKESMKTLLQNYDFIPKGEAGPPGNDAVSMSMTEIAKKVKLPVKAVGRLQNMGEIDRPITCANFDFLKSLEKIWGNHFFLRLQLARLSIKQREELIKRPELASKWERWLYSRYFFNKIKRGHSEKMINPEERIIVEDTLEMIEEMFHVPNCENTRTRYLEIRQMANNDRKKVKQGRSTERQALRSRGLPETELELWQDTFVFDMYS
ncbi:MAG: hypothetical protein OET55_00060 [Desulfuromonadales bacterium]|jgi:hypothetical protein|nr:hypothetical protein [Desulfuromonadales bacterium]MDH3807032.1 hypothetical protein [Desulfuromonadales bacterium]MDH3867749.1 hypothetical protein [Desulfuromonadales bacterium]MDH3959648.1 hypothetical protein [Desulfuromonadales bacterium]MDH4024407.1 hypothetical protein [Desulfuromonadales bacterium]